ncbi:MAG: aminotransferase class IV [Acidiferrobacterales bacterium]
MAQISAYGTGGAGFIDGEFMPLAELKIPVTDMGFQLSDMCYDAVHAWNGKFFRLEDHLDRWERAIAERRYNSLGYSREQVAEILHGCVARANLQKAMVIWIATRGSPATGQKDLRTCNNRLIAWAAPYYAVVSDEEVERGCNIVVAQTTRIPPEAVDPTVKNFGRLDFVQAVFEAYEQGARHAVLLDDEGYVTEGRGWNIFALTGHELLSPDRGVLEGITRKTVLELSVKLNLNGRLGRIKAEKLRGADEVFLSSTSGGIVPVNNIDGQAVGNGEPGPVTCRLRDMYWALHDDPSYATPVRYELGDDARQTKLAL